MKFALISLGLLLSFYSLANDCTVAVPKSEFIYEGYPIYFDFTKLLHSRGYQVIDVKSSPRFTLTLQGQMTSGRWFRSAETGYVLHEFGVEEPRLEISKTKTCYFTDLCAVSDFRTAFTRGFRELEKKLPHCE